LPKQIVTRIDALAEKASPVAGAKSGKKRKSIG
jgi:hypothetical protein